MHNDSRPPATGPGYASGPVTKAPDWHGLVAWDLLFNNLTTGLFLVAATCELAAPAVFSAVAQVAYSIALVLLVADLVFLVLDLGDPLRFHHMLRVFKLTSPMSLGTWCLTIYSFPLTVAAALSLLPEGGLAIEWARKLAVVLGLLPALGSAVYKGVLLSTNAQPGWRDARWMGGYLTNSALMLGSAELLTLAALRGEVRAISIVHPALALLLIFNAIFLALLLVDLWAALRQIFVPRQLWRLGLLTLGGGTLTPLGLLFCGHKAISLLCAVILLMLGSLLIRFVII